MRDCDALRTRLALALSLGLGGCDGEPSKGKESGVKESKGEPVNKETKSSGSASASKGGVAQVVSEIRAGVDETKAEDKGGGASGGGGAGSADGGHEPTVDPVSICGNAQTTVTVTDADHGRFSPKDVLGCAESTEPVGVSGPANFTLDQANTQRLRDAGNTEHCCYRILRPPRGRPLMVGGRPVLPTFGVGPRIPTSPTNEPRQARRAAAAWLHDARMEWASVASFFRAAEELRTLDAPPTLRADYLEAAEDERRHAAACVQLAERLAGRRLALGPLPRLAPRSGGLMACLQRTFAEGCVAETAAALVATRAARRARPDIAAVLATIADDEAGHAGLAWTTVGWGLARCSPAQRRAWIGWAREQCPPSVAPGPCPYAHLGQLDGASERALLAEAWARCIAPLLDELEAGLLVSEPEAPRAVPG